MYPTVSTGLPRLNWEVKPGVEVTQTLSYDGVDLPADPKVVINGTTHLGTVADPNVTFELGDTTGLVGMEAVYYHGDTAVAVGDVVRWTGPAGSVPGATSVRPDGAASIVFMPSPGPQGVAGEIVSVEVETGAPDSAVLIDVGGTPSQRELTITIPRGRVGPAGPTGANIGDAELGVDVATPGQVAAVPRSLALEPGLMAGVTMGVQLVRPIDMIGGRLLGTHPTTFALYWSDDDAATWSSVGKSVPTLIQRAFDCADGEILVMSGPTIYRSSGWATPATSTFTAVHTKFGTSTFVPWSMDGDGTKFIAGPYGPGTGTPWADSRYVHISTDMGQTWTQVWDSDAEYPGQGAASHLHAMCYDPWEDRFWFTEGHNGPRGAYWSDDDGATWTKLGGAVQPDPMPTVMVATDDGIVCGSDSEPNGIYTIPRVPDPATLAFRFSWNWASGVNGLVGFGQRGARDPRTGIVYIGYGGGSLGARGVIAGGTASAGGLVWTAPTGDARVWNTIVTPSGALVNDVTDGGVRYNVVGRIVPAGRPTTASEQNATGGRAAGTSVAVGPGATALFNQCAVFGRNAVASNTEASVFGYGATATGSFSAVHGHTATAANDGSAFGAGSVATANSTVAGRNATTTGTRSAVFGRAATGATDCAAFGASSTAATGGAAFGYLANAGPSSVSAGPSATTATWSSAIAIGPSANVTAAFGLAAGAAATAGSSSIAFGRGSAAAGLEALAAGRNSSASATNAIAFGTGSVCAQIASIALGSTTTATAASQLAIGSRHIELIERTADPTAPAADAVRWYARDNGSGKTQLCARFATGAIQVIATEP